MKLVIVGHLPLWYDLPFLDLVYLFVEWALSLANILFAWDPLYPSLGILECDKTSVFIPSARVSLDVLPTIAFPLLLPRTVSFWWLPFPVPNLFLCPGLGPDPGPPISIILLFNWFVHTIFTVTCETARFTISVVLGAILFWFCVFNLHNT